MSLSTNDRIFISGQTGSGKTTLASKLFEEETTLCIFVNAQHEVLPEKSSQIIVNNVSDLRKAIEEGYTKICYNPTLKKEITIEEVVYIKRLLFSIGFDINKKRQKPVIIAHVFIDEIHEYSSKFKPNAEIDSIWKRGRRFGVIGIGMSQRPADVSHTILTQSKYHVIFNINMYETGYFDRYHIPIEKYKQWIQRPYHFVVFDGYRMEPYRPIDL